MRSVVALCLPAVLVLAAGCQSGEDVPEKPPVLVPVTGKVTLDGKPLGGASIGFLPATGPAGADDVDEDGSYKIQYQGSTGLPAGDYVVQISYKMGTHGKPLSIGEQFSLVPSKGSVGSKELLPKKYSDFGASELRAKVPAGGGTFDFDLKGPLADPPPLKTDAPEATGKAAEKPRDEAPTKGAAGPAKEAGPTGTKTHGDPATPPKGEDKPTP